MSDTPNPSTTETPQLPLSISGGCICRAIRFTITFPSTAPDWPPTRVSTCQCTQCRKSTGSLYGQGFAVPTSYLSPNIFANPALKSYTMSPASYWSFCGTCGSRICINDGEVGNGGGEETYMHVGSLDEDVLCGRKGEDGKREVSQIGKVLAKPVYHLFMENAIVGLTDGLEGKHYQQNSS